MNTSDNDFSFGDDPKHKMNTTNHLEIKAVKLFATYLANPVTCQTISISLRNLKNNLKIQQPILAESVTCRFAIGCRE